MDKEKATAVSKKQSNSMIRYAPIIGLAVIALVLFIAFGNNKKEIPKTPEILPVVENRQEGGPAVTVTELIVEAEKFRDGTFSATGNYTSPNGPEEIDVEVTLKDNRIVFVDVISKATVEASKKWQGEFIANYKDQVIGRDIKDLKLEKVSGSSLTPKGFNAALLEVKRVSQES